MNSTTRTLKSSLTSSTIVHKVFRIQWFETIFSFTHICWYNADLMYRAYSTPFEYTLSNRMSWGWLSWGSLFATRQVFSLIIKYSGHKTYQRTLNSRIRICKTNWFARLSLWNWESHKKNSSIYQHYHIIIIT